MKNFLLLTLIVFISVSAYAQNPLDSFYVDGTAWTTFDWFNAGMHNTSSSRTRIKIKGDTVYNSIKYKKLVYDKNTSVVIGGVRVDSQKVYFIRLDSNISVKPFTENMPVAKDQLIYDYGLSVGDSMEFIYPSYTGSGLKRKAVVSSVDTVNVLNRKIRRLKFDNSPYDDVTWLEGPGSNYSFWGNYVYTSPPYFSRIQCYFLSDKLAHWYSGDISHCWPTDVDEVASKVYNDRLYPNPIADNELNIDLARSATVSIYNIHGQVAQSHMKLKKGQHRIKAPSVSGLYFVKIVDELGKVNYLKFEKL